tara:strand:+ start:5281 stop:5541 length:261 start_codon:yes stop_codon:yes gene_type:complete
MNKTRNDMSFHRLLDDITQRVSDIPQQYFEEQNRLKLLEIKKRNEVEALRDERLSSTDYDKELKRNDLTQTQRIFYRKMSEWQKNK